MKVILHSLLLTATLFCSMQGTAQAATFNDYYPMNPDAVTSVTITNRSSNTNDAASCICDVPELKGVAPGPIFAYGGAGGFNLTALPGEFECDIPEYIGVTIYENGSGDSADTTAVGLYLGGVVIGCNRYSYDSGWYGVWVWSPDGTIITLDAWTDMDGSLHMDFYIDDEPGC